MSARDLCAFVLVLALVTWGALVAYGFSRQPAPAPAAGPAGVQVYSVKVPAPSPHPGIPVTNQSGTAPRTVCAVVVLDSDQVPNGSLVEVWSMMQVGHNYTPYYMIAGFLRVGSTQISRAHGTNLNRAIHHKPLYHFGDVVVTEANRAKLFDAAGALRVEQIGYAAGPLWSGGIEPPKGAALRVEAVQLKVRVTLP